MTSLFALILIPLVFAAYAAFRPAREAKMIALVGTLAALAITIWTCIQFDWTQGIAMQFEESIPWLTNLGGIERVRIDKSVEWMGGVTLSVGVDPVSMLLIALTALLGPICILSSFTAITERTKTYYTWFLVLQAAMTGVFASRDLILFYTCFEFTLIPMWILIHLYGSTNRGRAATKFFLYTFTGSLVALAGLVYVVWFAQRTNTFHAWSFDIGDLQHAAKTMSPREQGWVLFALLAGFAVKVPIFPLHTWLPLAHTEAPTAGSVILAGVLLKLGTYGIYRFALPFCPWACWQYAPTIAVLSIIGIVYAGLICWVQTDVKKLVAYSSVAHLGFCILGMFAFNVAGLTGSVLYMINHGLSTGALFLMIGFVYERYHTRSMKELGGLASKMPIWATFMVFFTMASVGLPGLNGFVSEFLCIFGAFQAGKFPGPNPGATGPGPLGGWWAFAAGTGMIVAAMYLLIMLGNIVWGMLKGPPAHQEHGLGEPAPHGPLPRDLNLREIITILPLALGCLVLGVYPLPLMKTLEAPTNFVARLVHEGHARAGLASERRGAAATPTPAAPVEEAAR
jgi:NADH-quinone oxidoreductase subunit M